MTDPIADLWTALGYDDARAFEDAPVVTAVHGPGAGTQSCRVYWGSHGCELPRGHEGDCVCCDEPCPPGECVNAGADCTCNVGTPPYYGPETRFYGEDVEARGLPVIEP
jgi:hypothetical protein